MSVQLECRHGPLDGDVRTCVRRILVVGFAPRSCHHVAISVDAPNEVASPKLSGCYIKETDHLRWVPYS